MKLTKIRLIQFKVFSVLMLILIGYNQCGNPYNIEQGELEYSEQPMAKSLSGEESLNTFRTSVYTITSQYCVSCHTTQSPTHAHPDAQVAHDSLIALHKVNFQNVSNSRIVAKIRDENHSCWGDCQDNADEMQAMVQIWADKVNALEEEEEEQGGTNGNGGNTSTNEGLSSLAAFEQTVYQITTENCIQCHQNTSPQHANNNIQLAHDSLLNQGKIDFNNIPNSRMVQRLRTDGHNCWGNCEDNAQEMESAIEQWADLMEESTSYTVEGIVTGQSDYVSNELASNSASSAVQVNLANGNIVSPFAYDNAGAYLWAPAGSGNNFDANSNAVGMATYNFNVTNAATYKMQAEVSAPSNNDNSFFFSVDGGNFFDWHIDLNNGFTSQIVTRTSGKQEIDFNLSAGPHTIVIKQREDNTKLKSLSFVEFDGNSILPPGTVYLSYDLKDVLGTAQSVIFRIKLRDHDEYTYEVFEPEIISPYNIRVEEIKLLLNNYYNPQHSTYTYVNTTVTPNNTVVVPYSMIVLKDQGNNLDRISFEFKVLEVIQ
jgi:hypothetical protein